MLTTGIRFIALCIIELSLCIITLSLTSAACGDMGQCIGDCTNAIVGNADLTIWRSVLAIINKPAIELSSKIPNFM